MLVVEPSERCGCAIGYYLITVLFALCLVVYWLGDAYRVFVNVYFCLFVVLCFDACFGLFDDACHV